MAHSLGIVGSGAIACGLARAASEHHEVVVWARSERSAARAEDRIEGARVVTDLADLGACDVVVEAVAEDPEVKRDLHRRLGELLPPEAVIATTTSSLSVAELAAASGRPERFAALHVFNPVEKMELVELSFPEAASDQTRSAMSELCRRLGKTGIEVPDSPGFVVNRLLFPYLFDAVRMLERDSIDPEAIDTCMKLGAGHPMGPLALLDFIGLDVAAAIGESIGTEVPGRVRELIEQGRLGTEGRRRLLRDTESLASGAARRRGLSGAMPAARSQTTSASSMFCAAASSATRSHGRDASGRSSQRARSSASSAAVRAGPGSDWALISSRRALHPASLSLTLHTGKTSSRRKFLPGERSPPYGRKGASRRKRSARPSARGRLRPAGRAAAASRRPPPPGAVGAARPLRARRPRRGRGSARRRRDSRAPTPRAASSR